MPHFEDIGLVSHPHYLEHDTHGGEHPEIPDRIQAISERLRASPLAKNLNHISPQPAERCWLTTFHIEEYLLRFEETALAGKTYLDHRDNQLCYESYEAALLSAGAGLTAIDRLEAGKEKLQFCLVRPPGHHAEHNMALGFCFLNNSALAARYWQKKYQRQRIMIIDWDAHHGNGIQSAFEEDEDVLYVSIHEHPTFSFPGSGYAEEIGTAQGRGTILNIPLPPGAGDAMVLNAMSQQVIPAIADFQPERIIVSAGFDGHRLDDMSGLNYSTDLYTRLGKLAASWARQYCNGRLLSILEGGYHLESLAAGVEAYLTGISCLGE